MTGRRRRTNERVRLAVRLAAGLIVCAARAAAQDPAAAPAEEPPPASFAEEILVTAPKAPTPTSDEPGALDVITAEEIAASPALTLPDLLAVRAGFHVYDPSGAGTEPVVDLRGFYSAGETSYVLLRVDGVPVNDLETDAVDWNLVDLSGVERVEVLRGPVSSLYGNVGLSGLVDVTTRRRATPGVEGSLSAAGGSPGREEAAAAAAWAHGLLGGNVSGRSARVEGWRDHSDWNGDHLQASLQRGAGEATAVALHLLGLETDRERPGPIPLGTRRDAAGTPLDREEARTLQAGVSLSRPLAGGAALEGFARLRDKEQEIVETLVGASLGHDVESDVLGGELRLRLPLGRDGRLLAGAEAERGRLDGTWREAGAAGEPGAPLDRAEVERTSLAGFASAEVELTRRLALSGGVRHDRIQGEATLRGPADAAGPADADLSATSPMLALNWRWGSANNAFVSAGRSFKAPTLEQLFDRRPFELAPGLPPLILSNPALEPQRAKHLEGGLRARLGRRAETELALYALEVEDEIGFDLANLRFANIARSDHRGAEWSLSSELPQNLSARLAWTFARATFDGGVFDGNQINGVPRHTGAASLAWRGDASGRGPRAQIEVWHRRDQYLDEANQFPLDAATLVHAIAGYRFRRFAVDLAARNLFNARHDADGFLSLDETGAPLALILPGAERSIIARLRLDL